MTIQQKFNNMITGLELVKMGGFEVVERRDMNVVARVNGVDGVVLLKGESLYNSKVDDLLYVLEGIGEFNGNNLIQYLRSKNRK